MVEIVVEDGWMYVSKRSHLEHYANVRRQQQKIYVFICIKNYDI
jgi:hypothetical protein